MNDKEKLKSAVKLLENIKKRAMHARMFIPDSAMTIGNRARVCTEIEGDVEEWLNENVYENTF